MSELGVFRVMETVTLEIVNLLWDRDLCATPHAVFLKEVYKKDFYGSKMLPGDAARCVGTRPRSVFGGADYQ